MRKLSKHNTISQFLDEWPILKTQIAPELVSYNYQFYFVYLLIITLLLISYDFDKVKCTTEIDVDIKFQTLFDSIFEKCKPFLSPADNTITDFLEGEITKGILL